MKGMVLAAGVGSRLDPLTAYTPKPMVPLGNRPAMEHILALLAQHNITEVAANLWYLPEQIMNYFADGSNCGVNLHYSEEQELLGTAGGVRKLAGFFDETFVVIAGDALTDINLSELIFFHQAKGAVATIAVKPVDDPTHYGVVVTDESGQIKGFQEKPKPSEALSMTANTGIYVFEPEILNLIPQKTFYDFGRQLFPRLVAEQAPFYAFETRDYWCDIGTHQVYRQANLDIVRGQVHLYTSGMPVVNNSLLVGADSSLNPEAELVGANSIGKDCIIGQAYLRDSVLWDQVKVGDGVRVEAAIIGSGVVLRDGAVIPAGCVIGAGSIIGPGANLQPGEVVAVETVQE